VEATPKSSSSKKARKSSTGSVAEEEPPVEAKSSSKKARKSSLAEEATPVEATPKASSKKARKSSVAEEEIPVEAAPKSSSKKSRKSSVAEEETPVEAAVEEEQPQSSSKKADRKSRGAEEEAPKTLFSTATKKPREEGDVVPPRHERPSAYDITDAAKRETTLRCGSFVELSTEGVEALAGNARWMAVGRASGEIEVWEKVLVKQNPVFQQRLVVPGSKSQTLRCLVWLQDRLFIGNLNGTLGEVDLYVVFVCVV
jgi:hypothetical protein